MLRPNAVPSAGEYGHSSASSHDRSLIESAKACAAGLLAEADGGKLLPALRLAADGQPMEADHTEDRSGSGGPVAAARVGPYTLLERLGEGGFGIVFRAEQERPVRRQVALKIIKPGMDTAEVVARFGAERQALALMNHEHIAKVLDAGVTEGGRPYFVMELVSGVPITEHCDRNRLSTRDRLVLFRKVCAAVQHAHQKGVIHRDIKPSNVLVVDGDDGPSPKVIDFGIAKAIGASLAEVAIHTGENRMIGTPIYMSPEQSGCDVDTRTDIYALGVLLFELLTGTTPLSMAQLRECAFTDVPRLIRDVDAPRPSTRLASLGPGLARVAADRSVVATRLLRLVRGDLDWIVLRALEKDRQRRYQTASDLSADVGRHLADLPVEAAAPSTAYRLTKLLRRHKGAAAAAALLAVTLLGGIAGTTYGLIRAEQRRADAELAQLHERRERTLAQRRERETARVAAFHARMLEDVDAAKAGMALVDDLARRLDAGMMRRGIGEADRLARVSELRSLMTDISAADAVTELLHETLLEPAVATIGVEFVDQPAIASTLREALADAYRDLGRYDDAVALQRSAMESRQVHLGRDDVATLRAMRKLGSLCVRQGRFEDAEATLLATADRCAAVLGPEHDETLEAIASLAALRREQDRLEEAEVLCRQVLSHRQQLLPKDDPSTLSAMGNLAMVLLDGQRFDEAEPLFREVLDARQRVLGPAHRSTLTSMSNLGALLRRQGRLEEAEPLYREVLSERRRQLGDQHPQTLVAMGNLAVLLQQQHRFEEAEPLQREVVAGRRRVLGDDHPEVLTAIVGLGSLLLACHAPAEAEALLRDAIRRQERVLGPRHAGTQAAKRVLADALVAQGGFPEAETLLLECIETADSALPKSAPARRRILTSLIALYEAWHAAAPDERLMQEAARWRAQLEPTNGA